jgi:hypothetical protein
MSADLEQQLRDLSAHIEVPPAPDVVPAVLARLPQRHSHRGRPARRTLVVAIAVVLACAGAAIAVPQTRHAVLRALGLRGVSIERVPRLRPVPVRPRSRLDLGRPISPGRARHAAGFTALLPAHPNAAYLNDDVPGGRISVREGRLLIIEFRGKAFPYIFKLIGSGTRVTRLRVNGGPGVYLSGAPHELLFEESGQRFRTDRIRLAGNVLLWQQGVVTARIEGTRSLTQALTVARSLH